MPLPPKIRRNEGAYYCAVDYGLQHYWSFLPFSWPSDRPFSCCQHVCLGSMGKIEEARCSFMLTDLKWVNVAIVTCTAVYDCAQTDIKVPKFVLVINFRRHIN